MRTRWASIQSSARRGPEMDRRDADKGPRTGGREQQQRQRVSLLLAEQTGQHCCCYAIAAMLLFPCPCPCPPPGRASAWPNPRTLRPSGTGSGPRGRLAEAATVLLRPLPLLLRLIAMTAALHLRSSSPLCSSCCWLLSHVGVGCHVLVPFFSELNGRGKRTR